MTLTASQRDVLATVEAYREPPSTRRVADKLQAPGYRKERWTDSRVRGILRRLEARGLVERVAVWPARWKVTPAGYAVLTSPGEA